MADSVDVEREHIRCYAGIPLVESEKWSRPRREPGDLPRLFPCRHLSGAPHVPAVFSRVQTFPQRADRLPREKSENRGARREAP